MKKNHPRAYAVIGLLPICFIVICVLLIPFLTMIRDSLTAEDGNWLTFSNYVSAFTRPFYLVAIKNSALISLISTGVGLLAAFLIAYAITQYSGRFKDNLLMFINMTTNFSGVPLAFAFIILFGYSGIVTMLLKRFGGDGDIGLYSWTGVVMVYVYFQIPLGVLLLYPLFEGIRDDWRQAASILGASNLYFWTHVAIPVMGPGILGAFGILFANAIGSYATAYALVGGSYNMLTIRISSLVSGDVNLRPQMGSALAIILGLIIFCSVMLNEILAKRIRRTLS